MAKNGDGNDDKTGSLGFEDKLWAAADVLRDNAVSGELRLPEAEATVSEAA